MAPFGTVTGNGMVVSHTLSKRVMGVKKCAVQPVSAMMGAELLGREGSGIIDKLVGFLSRLASVLGLSFSDTPLGHSSGSLGGQAATSPRRRRMRLFPPTCGRGLHFLCDPQHDGCIAYCRAGGCGRAHASNNSAIRSTDGCRFGWTDYWQHFLRQCLLLRLLRPPLSTLP